MMHVDWNQEVTPFFPEHIDANHRVVHRDAAPYWHTGNAVNHQLDASDYGTCRGAIAVGLAQRVVGRERLVALAPVLLQAVTDRGIQACVAVRIDQTV